MTTFRCGDLVRHQPSGELWEVAWCEGDDIAWCGWPNGMARTADCTMHLRATDEQHRAAVGRVVKVTDSRGPRASRLYKEVMA